MDNNKKEVLKEQNIDDSSPKKSVFSRFIVEEDENPKKDEERDTSKKIIKEPKAKEINKKNKAGATKKPSQKMSKKEAERMKMLKNGSTYVLGLVIKSVVYCLLVAAIYVGCMKAYSFGSAIFDETGVESEGREVVVTIPSGATTTEVATILKENNLIKDVNIFKIQAKLFEGNFKSGTFKLKTSYGPEKIIEILSENVVQD